MLTRIINTKRLGTWMLSPVLAGLGIGAMSDWKAQGSGESWFFNPGEQDPRGELTVEFNNNGFSPTESHHAPGSFAIAVQNKTLSGEYTLKLLAEDGTLFLSDCAWEEETISTLSRQRTGFSCGVWSGFGATTRGCRARDARGSRWLEEAGGISSYGEDYLASGGDCYRDPSPANIRARRGEGGALPRRRISNVLL